MLGILAVGSVNPILFPGHFAILSQFIDWTKSRPSTFFDGEDGQVLHVDVTHPYCPRTTGKLLRAGDFLGAQAHGAMVYACTEGPRFETAAEVQALRLLGADVVGMTNVPEVVLAREAGLCYAAVCIVCNWGAGISSTPLTQQEVLDVVEEQTPILRKLIYHYLSLPTDGECACRALGFGHQLPNLSNNGCNT